MRLLPFTKKYIRVKRAKSFKCYSNILTLRRTILNFVRESMEQFRNHNENNKILIESNSNIFINLKSKEDFDDQEKTFNRNIKLHLSDSPKKLLNNYNQLPTCTTTPNSQADLLIVSQASSTISYNHKRKKRTQNRSVNSPKQFNFHRAGESPRNFIRKKSQSHQIQVQTYQNNPKSRFCMDYSHQENSPIDDVNTSRQLYTNREVSTNRNIYTNKEFNISIHDKEFEDDFIPSFIQDTNNISLDVPNTSLNNKKADFSQYIENQFDQIELRNRKTEKSVKQYSKLKPSRKKRIAQLNQSLSSLPLD